MKLVFLLTILLILKSLTNEAEAFMFWNQAGGFAGGTNTSYISVPSSNSLNISGSFTIEAWVNPVNSTSPGSQIILTKRAGNNNNGYTLLLTGGKVAIRTNSTIKLTGSIVISSNQWTHIAGTYDAPMNTFKVYINGVLDATGSVAGAAPVQNTDSLFIGKGVDTSFSGSMDEVRLWNRALTLLEINQFRRTSLGTSSGVYSGLVLSMTFQDKESTGSDFVLTDWSGNNNNGINRGVTAVDLSDRPSVTVSPNESIEFDGTNDYLAGPDNSNVSPTSALTLEAWIWPRDTNVANVTILHKGPANGNNTNYRLRLDNSTITAAINANNNFSSLRRLVINRWSHVAFTYDGSTGEYSFYVNGSLTNSGTNSLGNVTDGSDSLYIGGTPNLSCYNGFIDEVRISDYAKTQAQINKYLYQSIDKANVPDTKRTNVVYNMDGYNIDNAGSGPRLYFHGNACFSYASTVDNQPVTPIDRSNALHFQDSYYIKNSNKTIGPSGIVYDTLELFYDKKIQDLNLFIALNHNNESNLEISLIGPDGNSVKVFDKNTLVTNSDNIVTIFDDQSDSSLVNSRYVSFGPSIKPANNLNTEFSDDTLSGKWILKINDIAGAESGTLYAWGLQVNNETVKVPCLKLSVMIQGLYRPTIGLNFPNSAPAIKDTIRVCLRKSEPPYQILDCAPHTVPDDNSDSPFPGAFFQFPIDPDDFPGNGYLQINHRSSIETYSAGVSQPTGIASRLTSATGVLNYNYLSAMSEYDMLTDSSKALGSNLIRVQTNPNWYAIYSGDVNQDGIVDITDNLLIDNDANNFITGYVNTDLNGDEFVDVSDAAIADNNAYNFVSKVIP